MTLQAWTLLTTIVLAFLGYLVTYANSLRLERRKAEMAFLNDQLQFLYGPLFSLQHASGRAWDDFRSRCRPGGSFFGVDLDDQPTESELAQWRMWMT